MLRLKRPPTLEQIIRLQELSENSPFSYRTEIVLLVNEGLTVTEIHRVLNRVQRTVQSWLQKWNQDEFEAFEANVVRGNNHKLSLTQRKLLVELAKTSLLDLDLPFSKRSLTRLSVFAQDCHRIPVGKERMRQVLQESHLKLVKLDKPKLDDTL